jgi:hypothetical protein
MTIAADAGSRRAAVRPALRYDRDEEGRRGRMRILERLTPSEPLFPYDADIIPIYPRNLPPVVKNWCWVAIAANLVTLAVGTLLFRSFAPTLMFLAFTLFGPLNVLLFWRSHIKMLNRSTDDMERQSSFLVLPLPYPSIEWLAIAALVMTSVMDVCVLLMWGYPPAR